MVAPRAARRKLGGSSLRRTDIFDTLALLASEVHRMLGHPGLELLHPEDTTAAAVETLAYYGLESQFSQHGRTSKSVTFYPSSRNAPVNKASDMAVPAYVERATGSASQSTWQWIPTTHPSLLNEQPDLRCAWERDSGGLRLLFNYDPTGGQQYRLHYYSDPVIALSMEDPMGLPQRYRFLFTHKSLLNAIPTMMNRAAKLPEERQMNSAQLSALNATIGHSQDEVKRWEKIRKNELDAEGAPRGRDRRSLIYG